MEFTVLLKTLPLLRKTGTADTLLLVGQAKYASSVGSGESR